METGTLSNKRQCPECGVKLTRYEWSKLWWMSGIMSGRLVQPCVECGAKLRMSAMALVSTAASIGLIITALSYWWFYPNGATYMLIVALGLLLVILVAMLVTRIEIIPPVTATLEPPPERIGKKRL